MMQEMECEYYYICEYYLLIMESVPLFFRYIFIFLLNIRSNYRNIIHKKTFSRRNNKNDTQTYLARYLEMYQNQAM